MRQPSHSDGAPQTLTGAASNGSASARNSVAISVPVPTQRFQNQQTLIAEKLLATKHALEAHMNSGAA